MPVVGFLSGWKPVATDMTRPPSPLAMLIATYKAAPIQGGPIFLHEAGAAPLPVALFWGRERSALRDPSNVPLATPNCAAIV